MRTIDCPACGHGFLKRKAGRCPRCRALLVNEGEAFVNDEGDRVFLRCGRAWFEVVA